MSNSAAPAAQRSLLDVRVTPAREQYLAVPSGVLVQVLVDVRPTAENLGGPPIDLRLVVDASGSMRETVPSGEEKIRVVGEGLVEAARLLTPRDHSMLVFFHLAHTVAVAHGRSQRALVQQIVEQAQNRKADGGTHFAGALEAALHPTVVKDDTQTRLVFFTDGNNQGHDDSLATIEWARRSRQLNIPWCVYATGEDYNWSFLEQLVAQAGPGSYLFHVSDPTALAGHLVSEMALLRQVAVDRLVITGKTNGAKLKRVIAFMPAERSVENDGFTFRDDSGALDVSRGQRLLIEFFVPTPTVGRRVPLQLTLAGRSVAQGLPTFSMDIDVPITFIDDPLSTVVRTVHPEVVRVEHLLRASAMAKAGRFDDAATAFQRAGDPAAAEHMTNLGARATRGHTVDATRDATSFSATTMLPRSPKPPQSNP